MQTIVIFYRGFSDVKSNIKGVVSQHLVDAHEKDQSLLNVRACGDSPVSWWRHTCDGDTSEGRMRARATQSAVLCIDVRWPGSSMGAEKGTEARDHKTPICSE